MHLENKIDFPEVAVVLLNWKTPEMTISAIESIKQSDYPNISIHITDNYSNDQSYDLINNRFGDQVYLYQSDRNRGYGGGMNFCLEHALTVNPYFFLIMNNDTIIDNHAITALVETSQKHQNKCIVTGKVYFYDQKQIIQTVGNQFDRIKMNGRRIGFGEPDSGQYDIESEREMIDDIFMLVPVSIYNEVGGYSTYFFMNYESTDLIIRIMSKGYKAIYTPLAKLWHKGSFSSGGLGNPFMMYWEGRSLLIIHFMHQTRFNFSRYYINHLGEYLWSLGKGVVKKAIWPTSDIKPRIAIVRGFVSGTCWLLNKKPSDGNNPYAKKR